MKKKVAKKKMKKILELFDEYKTYKEISDLVKLKQLPPFTLDQQIESINPYYVRSEAIKYG